MSGIWVAMSGGVDSSVAAARLVREGHHVTGVTMQLLPEGEGPGRCCSTDALRVARRTCDLLGIDHYTLNVRDVFESEVVETFVRAYAQGRTPNPCVVCNDRVKFAYLLARARTHGADALATGHYARIVRCADDSLWLHRGRDTRKDQSYFLYRLQEPAIGHVRFPLGEATKDEVRREARELGLPTAERSESQEVCFVSADAGSFVIEQMPDAGLPGPIIDTSGRLLGTHRGIARYTVGQRKGLGLSGGPWYVTEIRDAENAVVVSRGTPSAVHRVELMDVVYRGELPAEVDAVVRYRAMPVSAVADRVSTGLVLAFERGIPPVARGQAVVCYQGDRVLGGGVVEACR